MIGKEITWVRGVSFDQLIKQKKALPTKHNGIGRICTTWLKVAPAFEFWLKYNNNNEKWGFNVGYRLDEQERKNEFLTTWKYPYQCSLQGKKRMSWLTVEWRYGLFPLVDDRILPFHVSDYWKPKAIKFAEDSNCQHCIFKKKQQVWMNNINNPNQISWANKVEKGRKHTWHDDYSIEQAINMDFSGQLFYYGGGVGCGGGECTN